MRFLRLPLLALFLLLSLALPMAAYAQSTNTIFDPIIPEACKCAKVQVTSADGLVQTGATSPSAPGWGCVLTVVQNVINTAVGIAIIVVVLAIVYAGFMLMTSGSKPDARTKARHLIANALIGLLVLLGAWLLVDFVLKFVYNPNAIVSGDTKLGPWHGIGASNGSDMCLVVREPTPIATGVVGFIADLINGPNGPLPNIGVAGALCADSNTACSVNVLKAAGLSGAQANAMSCIAVTESTGNPNTPKSSTGACGTFQITTRPGNWSNPKYHGPGCSTSTSCNNAKCNLQTAVIMFKEQGYQPWTGIDKRTGRHWNPNAVACVNKYDPR